MFELVYRFDPAKAASYQAPQTSEEACRRLVQGNREFAEMTDASRKVKTKRVIPFDPRAFGWGGNGGAPLQAPFAAVLTPGSDRIVFSKGCNELSLSGLGECARSECLAVCDMQSVIFLPRLLVVVLSHGCVVVTEAVDLYLEPRRYLDIATDYSSGLLRINCCCGALCCDGCGRAFYGLEVAVTHDVGPRSRSRRVLERRLERLLSSPGISHPVP
jgi:carbonic anhydrase